MPRPPALKPPYCLDKTTGRAYVRIRGRKLYLGPHGTQESRDRYDVVVAEWIAAGRQRAPAAPPAATPGSPDPRPAGPATVAVLILRFWEWAKTRYPAPPAKEGQRPAGELGNFRDVLRPLRRYYGDLPAGEFSPLKLKALRQTMVDGGWSRTYVNRQVGRVRFVFRWGAGEELVPAAVPDALDVVAGLRRGELGVRETARVRPPPPEIADAVRARLSDQIRDMVEVQALTGMRSGELVVLRTCDVDRSAEPWAYRPEHHKTAHHDLPRVIRFGDRARQVLTRYLNPADPAAYLFRPTGNRAVKPRYTKDTYAKEVARAAERAFPPPADLASARLKDGRKARWETRAEHRARLGPERWAALLAWRRAHRFHPHQLRHAIAARVRKEFGPEHAQSVMGHSSFRMTEHYARRSEALAADVASRIG